MPDSADSTGTLTASGMADADEAGKTDESEEADVADVAGGGTR
jgi:hypothetical protein